MSMSMQKRTRVLVWVYALFSVTVQRFSLPSSLFPWKLLSTSVSFHTSLSSLSFSHSPHLFLSSVEKICLPSSLSLLRSPFLFFSCRFSFCPFYFLDLSNGVGVILVEGHRGILLVISVVFSAGVAVFAVLVIAVVVRPIGGVVIEGKNIREERPY